MFIAKYRRKPGSSLITVLCVFAMMLILSFTLITASVASHGVSTMHVKKQQAYFSARSAVSAMAQYIQNGGASAITATVNASQPDFAAPGSAVVGTGGNASFGNYKVTAWFTDATKTDIKIKAVSVYGNVSETVTATLHYTSAAVPGSLQYLFYVNQPSGSFLVRNSCNFIGNLFINGDAQFTNYGNVSGMTTVLGNVELNSNAVCSGITASGDLYMTNGSSINGSVAIKGRLKMDNNTSITCDATKSESIAVDRYLFLSGSGININGNIKCGGDLTYVQNNKPTIRGNAAAGGQIGYVARENGSVTPDTSFISGLKASGSSYTPVQIPPRLTLQNVSVPARPASPPAPVRVNSNTYSLYDGSVLTSFPYVDPYVNCIIENGSADASIYINTSSIDFYRTKLYARSVSHNVYIYLLGNNSLNLTGSGFIGMLNPADKPTVFIIGNGTGTITLNDGREIDGFIYLPNGSFSTNGSNGPNGYKLYGGVTAKNVDLNGVNIMKYVTPPDLPGTHPLYTALMASGGAGGGAGVPGTYTITNWSVS